MKKFLLSAALGFCVSAQASECPLLYQLLKTHQELSWIQAIFYGNNVIPKLGRTTVIGWAKPTLKYFPYNKTQFRDAKTLLAWVDTTDKKLHAIGITIPVDLGPAEEKRVIAAIYQVLEHLPEKHIESVKQFRVNMEPDIHDLARGGTALATANREGIIDIYPAGFNAASSADVLKTTRHEIGHTIAVKLWKSFEPPAEWIEAINADNVSVSTYGDTGSVEDFAEAVMIYLSSDAGKKTASYRKTYEHRFAYLDKLFEAHPEKLGPLRKLIIDSDLAKLRHDLVRVVPAIGIGGAVAYKMIDASVQKTSSPKKSHKSLNSQLVGARKC